MFQNASLTQINITSELINMGPQRVCYGLRIQWLWPDDTLSQLILVKRWSSLLTLIIIFIAGFRRQIDSPPVAFNLTEVISNLTNINASLQVAADAGSIEAQRIQMNITNVILQLENIRDVQIPSLRPLVVNIFHLL